jgi:hypothetical protein
MENTETAKNETMDVPGERWIELAKLSHEEFKSRRELEWKLAFGFWGAIGAFTAALLTERLNLPAPSCLWLLAFAYLLALVAAVALWMWPLQVAHADGKAFWKYYMEKAEGQKTKRPTDSGKSAFRTPSWSCRNTVWLVGEIAFTSLFLLLSWCVIASAGVAN